MGRVYTTATLVATTARWAWWLTGPVRVTEAVALMSVLDAPTSTVNVPGSTTNCMAGS